jgi:hypothetical protein
MTSVVELRDPKKSLPRPVAHLWQRGALLLCALRIRLAFLGLLGFALDYPFDAKVAPSGGVLALLCSVLSAAVSATLGLLCAASVAFYTLFCDDPSPVFRVGQGLSPCFGEQVFPFAICAEAGPFPSFSWPSTLALTLCALLLFGCGSRRHDSARHCQER